MNKIYRSVYNDSLGAWVAVSELDGHQGKRTGGVVKNTLNRAIRGFKLSQIALALGLGLGLSSTAAWAKDAEFSFSDPTIVCSPVLSPSDTSFVGGGENNTACNDYAFVGGGRNNTASGKYNFVGGGQNNLAGFPDGNWPFNGEYSSVVGGENNLASGKYTFVGGGQNNLTSGNYNFIGGGQNNTANVNTTSPYNNFSSIVGGQKNTTYGDYNFIGGGQNNTTSGNYSFVGGGQNNTASGKYSFVVGGQNNTASGNYSFVGGGFNSQALGLGSFSGGGVSTYYGYEYAQINGATAYGDNSFAFGAGAVANANDTIAIGRDTVAATTRQSNYEAAVAIGKNAKATAQNGIALGFDISNSGKNTFAIGSNITSTANNAVVLGVGSEGVDDAVSVGSQTSARKIVYVADGKLSEDSTDAVNGSQLHATNTRVDVLDTQVSTNTQSINQLTTDVANNTTNITNLSDTVGKGWSIASKGNAEAQKVAMGDTVEFTNKDGNIAVKHDGLSVSFDLAEELKLTSLTVGDKVTITNTGINAGDTVITNVANGNVAENSKDAVNGGQLFETNTRIDELSGSMSTLDGLAVKYDSDAKDKVTLGNPEKAVTLTNVADGKLSEDSTDAVNGSQLHATNTRVDVLDTQVSTNTQSINQLTTDVANNTTNITNLSDTVGKGWSIASKGNAEAQKVAMGDTVEFTNKDGNIAVKHDGLSVSFDLAEELKLTSLTVGDKVTITNTGINAGDTVITNVANGNVAENSKDAVNGGQLFETNTRIDELSGSMSTLDGLAVKYDSDAKDKVTLGNPEKAVTLTNVADGKLSEDSTDAVNGSQLHATNTRVDVLDTQVSTNTQSINQLTTDVANNTTNITNLSDTVGKGWSIASKGNAEAQKVAMGDTVEFTNKDGNIAVKHDGLSVSFDLAEELKLTSLTVGDKVTITNTGINAGDTVITNVANGNVAENSKDAVNGGQLFETNTRIDELSGSMSTLDGLAVKYDSDAKDKVTLGNPEKAVTLTNVADGKLSEDSTDAVNGSQLHATNTRVDVLDTQVSTNTQSINQLTTDVANNTTNITNLSDTVGKGWSIASKGNAEAQKVAMGDTVEFTNKDGNIAVKHDGLSVSFDLAEELKLTSLTVGDKVTITNTGINAGDTVITNVANGNVAENSKDAVNGGQLFETNTRIDELSGSMSTLDGLAVKYDSDAKDKVTLGNPEKAVTLTNVADGKLSEDSTDAVNGSQLHATNTRVDVLDTQVSTNTQSINQLTTDVANNTTNITNLSDTVGKGWSIASKGNAEAQKVAMGDTVEFTNKDGNIAVKHDGLSVSFDLAEELKLTSLTVGDKVTITNTGINAGDTVITNVANGNVAENSKDAVNGGQLFETNTRIDELSGSMSTLDGLAVKYDSDAKDKVTLGNPEKAVTLTNVADGKLSEDSTDAVNGSQLHATNTRVDVLDTQVSTNTQSINQLTTDVANNTTNITNLSDTVGKGWSIASKGNAEAQKVAMGDTVEFTNKDGNIAVKHDGLSVSFDLAEELKLTSLTVGDKVTITNTGINMDGTVITGLGRGTEDTDAVNVAQLNEIKSLIGTGGSDPLSVKYDNADKNTITLGGVGATTPVMLTNVAAGKLSEDSTDAVNGSQLHATNIRVDAIDKQVSSNTISIQSNTVAISELKNNALQYDDASKGSITLAGEDGTRISNVQDGVLDNDAATVGQLKSAHAQLANGLSRVEKKANQGSAAAIAVASLPQAVFAGENVMAVGGGVWRGQSGYSVGFSRATENGKWLIKANVTGSNGGDFGAGVGVGYRW